MNAVRAKVEDFFARTKVAAFDARSLGAVNRDQAEYAAIASADLDHSVRALGHFPLAQVAPDAPLPLDRGVNPAWRDAIATLRDKAVKPGLGDRAVLTESDWRALLGKLEGQDAWRKNERGDAVRALGPARVNTLAASDARAKLEGLLAEEKKAEPHAHAIESVERITRYCRDLMKLANNFVSFRDFYAQDTPATFQVGTLYLDQRACELCVSVTDGGQARDDGAAREHVPPLLRAEERGGRDAHDRRGDDERRRRQPDGRPQRHLLRSQGRRLGRDDREDRRQPDQHPPGVLGAVQEDAAARRGDDREARRGGGRGGEREAREGRRSGARKSPPAKWKRKAAAARRSTSARSRRSASPSAASPPRSARCSARSSASASGCRIGILALMFAISGPSMAIAWLKLRKRNLGPILDANGWAVNAQAKLNVPFGASLTKLASIPSDASRSYTDPFAEKSRPWGTYLMITLIVGGLAAGWYAGKLDKLLPKPARRTTILGAYEDPKPATSAAPAK